MAFFKGKDKKKGSSEEKAKDAVSTVSTDAVKVAEDSTGKVASEPVDEVAEARKKAAKKKRRQVREIRTFFTRLIVMIVFFYVLFFVVFGLKAMPNEDMKPRISAGDLLLYYRMEKKYYPDDVVVLTKDDRPYVGRIIALPGDEVEIPDAGGLRINGSSVVESDIFYSTQPYESDKISYPVKLGTDEYFILCDYRAGAKDSRYYGMVKASELDGKVITILRRSNL